MNSKVLQEKIKELQEEEIEMRLLKRSEKSLDNDEEKERVVSTSTSTVSLRHYDQLICDLRCPGCTSHLQAPIYLCMNGHSLCRLCRVSSKTCPVCDGDLTDIRSCTLERLSGKFQFPCKNLRNGCLVRLPMELMTWHEEKKCVFKKTSCFMGKIWHDCAWRGRENEWLQHCKQKHSQKILHKHESFDLVWSFETLKDNAGPIVAYYLIQNFGETFNLYQIHEAKNSMLTWTIILADHFINEDNKTKELPKFCFEFEFYNKQDPNFLLIQRFPVLYEDSEDVLDDGRCVKVSLADVQRFLDGDKNLFYRVKIISRKDKKDRWDQLLEQTIQHHNEDEGFSKNDDLAFFDDGDDKVFMEGERLVVIREKKEDDTLKQIFEKEFSPKCTHDESSKTIQKPPRKSLEYRKSSERSSYSSHNSMPFYE